MTQPDDPDESAESDAEKQARIKALAESIESTGTASQNPEGD